MGNKVAVLVYENVRYRCCGVGRHQSVLILHEQIGFWLSVKLDGAEVGRVGQSGITARRNFLPIRARNERNLSPCTGVDQHSPSNDIGVTRRDNRQLILPCRKGYRSASGMRMSFSCEIPSSSV